MEGIGLCDAREDLLRQRAAAFPAADGVQPFEALLRFDCHLVEILTPHPLHAELALQRSPHGEPRQCAEANGQDPGRGGPDDPGGPGRRGDTYVCSRSSLFYPPLQKAKEFLEGGAIRRPLHFRLKMVSESREFAWHVPPETNERREMLGKNGLGGPLVFDHGPLFDSCCALALRERARFFARIETPTLPSGRAINAPASALWRHVTPPVHGIWDVAAAPKIRVGTDYYASHEEFEIQGETGVIQVSRASGRLLDEPELTVLQWRGTGVSQHRERLGGEFSAVHRAFRALLGRAGRANHPDP